MLSLIAANSPVRFAGHWAGRCAGEAGRLCLAVALLSVAPVLMEPAMADDHDDDGSITITGTGTASGIPDIAMISTGVVTEGETAGEALSANTDAMLSIIETLDRAGIRGRDVQTSDFSVQPRFERSRDGRAPRIDGYRVVNSLRIRVDDIKALGDVLDAVVRDGSNQVGAIQFDMSDADTLRDRARADAVRDAQRKAEIYAEAAGVRLGRIIRIAEAGGGQPRPVMMGRAAMSESVPIEAGEATLSASVTVTWALDD